MSRLIATLLVCFFIVASSALPVQKHTTGAIADCIARWLKACQTAGGADQCTTKFQNAFQTLLDGKNCDQKDDAEQMVSFTNDSEMTRLAQLFIQQPRNAPNSLHAPDAPVKRQSDSASGTDSGNGSSSGYGNNQNGSGNFSPSNGYSPVGSDNGRRTLTHHLTPQFASLTAGSACRNGQQPCLVGGFA
ncbi:hypothetical protein BV25DRAFT_1834172 [Artomyces pyxidatus]|uniref:Uncharacterized protein n=1 Tax=Artomyces pyxidatus TaxID=48021 RepID=A0ACB8TL10_9AGAM|nr:hypothetical protein BV25DRAFT_1834172 [Artomyces pyxidatus]